MMTKADSVDPRLTGRGELRRSLDTPPVGSRGDNDDHTGERTTTAGHLILDGDPEAVPRARSWLREALSGQLPAGLVDDIELCGSELVTNAYRHSRSHGVPESIRVELARYPGLLTLAVYDQGEPIRPPVVRGIEPGDFKRGLTLVTMLADEAGHTESHWPVQERRSWALWRLPE